MAQRMVSYANNSWCCVTSSGSWNRYPGRSIGMPLGCVGMVKAQFELDLAEGAVKNKKGFYRYISQKSSPS